MIMKIMKKTFALAAAVSLVGLSSIGAMAADKLIVKDSGGSNNVFVVSDGGVLTATKSIGVGTTAPNTGIHVKSGTYPYNCIKAEGNEISQGAGFLGYTVRSDATLPHAADRLGFFLFGTINGATALHAAGMSAIADAQWTASSTPAYFTFQTTAATTTTRYDRLIITSGGNTQVYGGIQMAKNAGSPVKPNCVGTPATRGMIWYTQGGTNVADTVEICTKDGAGNYAWHALF
jgi:hypothetical protein